MKRPRQKHSLPAIPKPGVAHSVIQEIRDPVKEKHATYLGAEGWRLGMRMKEEGSTFFYEGNLPEAKVVWNDALYFLNHAKLYHTESGIRMRASINIIAVAAMLHTIEKTEKKDG